MTIWPFGHMYKLGPLIGVILAGAFVTDNITISCHFVWHTANVKLDHVTKFPFIFPLLLTTSTKKLLFVHSFHP